MNQYGGIMRCNHFVENYQRSRSAFHPIIFYGYFTFFFGDLQFVTKTFTVDDSDVYGFRENKKVAVDWMLQQLEAAATDLPVKYDLAPDVGRITKGSEAPGYHRTLCIRPPARIHRAGDTMDARKNSEAPF